MKKLIICGLTALAISSYAQATWNGSGTTGDANRTGRIGINTTSPTYALDVFSASGNGYDGISVTNANSSGNCGLFLKNSSISKEWQLWSLGTGNAWGAGNFCIYDGVSAQPQIFITNSTGNVGISTNNPTGGRLHVLETAANSHAGHFENYSTSSSDNTAIFGEAAGASVNVGGKFNGGGAYGTQNIGVWGVSSNFANDWAGYFGGRVGSTGGYFVVSDQRLKENVKPIINAIGNIKLLKPSTYTYKTKQFSKMALPEGEQMGLIAQELEEVFPELISEVKAMSTKNSKGEIVNEVPEHKIVNYTNLIPLLIAGMQEQQVQIESKQTTVDALQKQLDEQKQLINQLLQKAATPTGLDQNSLGAAGYVMEQNQPNPFNGVTTVKYTLPASVVNAYMAVYDLSGKQIASFPITEKGSSSINITSEKLAAGIYIYSIVADNKVIDSKRMIVSEK